MENHVDKCTIYYDDTNHSSTYLAEQLGEHSDIECKRASDYKGEKMIIESNRIVGFVFPSVDGSLPYNIKHLIWKIIMNKENNIFLVVSDGSRELKAVKSAMDTLHDRGYKVKNVYSKYIFEKYHVENYAEKILEDLNSNHSEFLKKLEESKELSKKELRKYVRKNMKEYKQYKKQKNKK